MYILSFKQMSSTTTKQKYKRLYISGSWFDYVNDDGSKTSLGFGDRSKLLYPNIRDLPKYFPYITHDGVEGSFPGGVMLEIPEDKYDYIKSELEKSNYDCH